jgi:hypothetical protein
MANNEASGLADVHRNYAKEISDYCLSASSRPARIQVQQVIAIVRNRKRVQCLGLRESLLFELLFPLAAFAARARTLCARMRCAGGLSGD